MQRYQFYEVAVAVAHAHIGFAELAKCLTSL